VHRYPVPARLSTADIRDRRWKVYSALLPYCGHELRLITTELIRRTFEALDAHFFEGYLTRRIREIGGVLEFKLSKSNKAAGSCGKKETQYYIKMSQPIFSRIFSTADEKILQADLNMHCSTRLACWIPTMEHELVHLLMHIDPHVSIGTGPYTPHGPCFQELAAALFDHNGIRHFLNHGDIENVKVLQEARELQCAHMRAELKVGDAVLVTYKEGVKREIVGKLNPKTVGVVTSHIQNGKPWFRKIPYHCVKKV
jgi:hypothetical protein